LTGYLSSKEISKLGDVIIIEFHCLQPDIRRNAGNKSEEFQESSGFFFTYKAFLCYSITLGGLELDLMGVQIKRF
jgi:hypothetical protein